MTFPLRPAKLEVTRTQNMNQESVLHVAWGLGPKQITNAPQAKQTIVRAQQEG